MESSNAVCAQGFPGPSLARVPNSASLSELREADSPEAGQPGGQPSTGGSGSLAPHLEKQTRLCASGLLGPAAGWAPAGSAVGTPQSSGPDAQESRGGCAERRPGHSEHCTVPGTQSTIPGMQSTIPGTQSTIPGTQSAVWGPIGPCASQLRADICMGLTEDTAAGANVPRRGACTLPGRPLEGLPGCSDRASVSGRQ